MQLYLEVVVRYIHFISVFTIVGALAAEWVLLKKEMLPQEIALIPICASLMAKGIGYTP